MELRIKVEGGDPVIGLHVFTVLNKLFQFPGLFA